MHVSFNIVDILIFAAMGWGSGALFGWLKWGEKKPDKIDFVNACCANGNFDEEHKCLKQFAVALETAEEEEMFTVAGKPRKPSWKARRKELEAKERTKRHAIEEWRD